VTILRVGIRLTGERLGHEDFRYDTTFTRYNIGIGCSSDEGGGESWVRLAVAVRGGVLFTSGERIVVGAAGVPEPSYGTGRIYLLAWSDDDYTTAFDTEAGDISTLATAAQKIQWFNEGRSGCFVVSETSRTSLGRRG